MPLSKKPIPRWSVPSAFERVAGILVVWAVLAITLFAGPARAEQRIALIIGNAAYSAIPSLDNSANDANDMALTLTELGFRVTLGIDRSREEMLDLIAGFGAEARTADVALFYYAGHAFQVSDSNYLIPTDFNPVNLEQAAADSIMLDVALNALAEAPGLKIVMLDACRDNRNQIPGVRDGLARVGSAADFLIVYATQPGAVASDGKGRNGTFTGALLHHIRTPSQDISEMMIAVRKEVIAQSGGLQIPWESSSLTRRFFFDDGPPTANSDTMLYQAAVRSWDKSLMNLYLQRYPEGVHAGDILAMLTEGKTANTQLRSIGPDEESGEQLWQLAQRNRLRPLFESYLNTYASGPHADEARRILAEMPPDADQNPARRCELQANHPRDGTETTPGVPFELLARNSVAAIRDCEEAVRLNPGQARYLALLARAYAASGLRDKAVPLFEQAAEQGDLRAMVSLALIVETGDGAEKDPAKAQALFEKAAAAGSPDAAINVAIPLLDENRSAADHKRGIALMQQASQSGAAIATFNLGLLARDGKFGTPADARALFERAAREGEPRAYREAAYLLAEGHGVAKSGLEASKYLLLGVASDDGSLLQELTAPGQSWPKDTLVEMQRRLGRVGLYSKGFDGLPGPALKQALEKWRNGGFNASALGS
ncbi:caspase family protein [Paracoccus sp. KR1-242]|uniref:caspase family protein n=1 Tax=Paracoccus sp. KR1-242 TaxID=3410028 RepID=UPI003C04A402